MSEPPEWLPPVLLLSDCDGDAHRFLSKAYGIFYRDFRISRPKFAGRPVVYDNTMSEGKEEAFWHIISAEDPMRGERIVDPRRCERIAWVRPILEHPDDPRVSLWRNRRGTHVRVLLWLETLDYLVVLDEWPNRYALITAYCTDYESTRRKLRKDRQGAH